MRGIPGTIAAAALLLQTSAQTQGAPVRQIFCRGLERVVEAARDEGGFLRLERSRSAPPHLGFLHGCRATGDRRRQYWLCNQSLAPPELSLESLAAQTAACFPEALQGKDGPYRETVFTLPGARIHISEHGGPRAHVGRIVELMVEAIPTP